MQRAGHGRRRRVRKLVSAGLRTLDLEPAAMADGNSNRGIAEAFAITEPAVEKHVTRICNMLGLHTRPRANHDVVRSTKGSFIG